ncbi:MAG: serine acetyltransferase [Methylomonas sp.]|nr:serine acetyltransferase [Methylomonas sp.]PPD20979.1 MAG: serine acetyltransferase [Methylomonas sp.]PPD27224.1 MAG: serine acetyltransferase [Methylomonas sp.]PPD39174.1 MAG: serine acetyltransferase [Methylomonas sp.]PPD41333.1 MAG: serine acetyltransferase [Methylomonas sp.]
MSDNRTVWPLASLVSELREIREQSLAVRQRLNQPPKLPSRKILAQLVDQIGAALFPNRLGSPDLSPDGVDYFVGQTLDNLLKQLSRQITLELTFKAKDAASLDSAAERAHDITVAFAAQLPTIRRLIDSDIQAAYEGDPAASSPDEVLICYPGIIAILHHRTAHALYRLGAPLVARVIAEAAHSATGIDIHPGAQIEDSFFIDHGTGVVIGETTIIGKRVRVYQAVTLGAKRFAKDENGHLVKGNARHPVVEDDVVIYAGATILGRITIGTGSVIGGNVWLTHSVPPHSHISQSQPTARLFSEGGGI